MATQQHDLIIIGGGPGGYAAAIRAAQLGMNVGCVDDAPELGGTCLRIGCIPSKALLEDSQLFYQAQTDFKRRGIAFNGLKLKLDAMMQRKEKVVGTLAKGVQSLFKKHQITHYQGHGRIATPGRVRVKQGEQEDELDAASIIIATGSRPAALSGVQWDGRVVGSSTDALAYREVPKHLVVIGAGYIGLELGSVWKRLGAEVTVLEYLDRILPGTDHDIARQAQKAFEQQGLKFRLGTRVLGAHVEDHGCRVECEGAQPIVCDRVLVAVGRTPNTEGLGLEEVGIELDQGKIPVDSDYQTRAEGIYAIGDVIGGRLLAHKAQEEGIACVERIADEKTQVDYNAIPGVVYTHPEIASVGRTEEELKQQGIDYTKGTFPYRANGRAQTLGEVDGQVKVLARSDTDRLLGVHIIGVRAGDVIAEAASAMAFGASSEDLALTPHAHPTLSEALKEAALAVQGRTIHL